MFIEKLVKGFTLMVCQKKVVYSFGKSKAQKGTYSSINKANQLTDSCVKD